MLYVIMYFSVPSTFRPPPLFTTTTQYVQQHNCVASPSAEALTLPLTLTFIHKLPFHHRIVHVQVHQYLLLISTSILIIEAAYSRYSNREIQNLFAIMVSKGEDRQTKGDDGAAYGLNALSKFTLFRTKT